MAKNNNWIWIIGLIALILIIGNTSEMGILSWLKPKAQTCQTCPVCPTYQNRVNYEPSKHILNSDWKISANSITINKALKYGFVEATGSMLPTLGKNSIILTKKPIRRRGR